MSFLPYARNDGGVWYSSVFASGVAHIGMVAILISGAVPFLPTVEETIDPLADVLVSLEIVDVDISPALEPLSQEDLQAPPEPTTDFQEEYPEDQTAQAPVDPVEAQEDEVVVQDSTEDVAPVSDEPVAEEAPAEQEPEDIAASETAPIEEAVVPVEDFAAQNLTPELQTPAPEAVPEIAEIPPQPEEPPIPPEPEPEPAPEPEATPIQDLAETPPVQDPVLPEPTPVVPDDGALDIADASLIEDVQEPLSPLAELGGGGSAAVENTDVVALPLDEEQLAALSEPQDTPAAIPVAEEETSTVTQDNGAGPTTEAAQDATPQTGAAGDQTADAPTGLPTRTDKGTVIAQPSPQARSIARIMQEIRQIPSPPCVMALPRRVVDGGVGLSLIGAQADGLTTYADTLASRTELDFTRSIELVDARQCAALDIMRQAQVYPATRIGVVLENVALNSGDQLKARILGGGGLDVNLFLVDDNGVVQNLARFSELVGNEIHIDAPVARVGEGRDTRQILMALGGSGAPLELSASLGELAQDAFTSLPPGSAEELQFGAVTFRVD